MSDEDDNKLVGRTIAGKFLIEKLLGGGAMGAVYRAKQTSLDKLVAVKVMHAHLAGDAMYATRFKREAKAASLLDHANSMRVLDFGAEPDGLLYIAMEYLEGRDLYKVIHEDWPLSKARIVDILSQALAALAVAHDMGVIHRDLKPENIMMLRGKSDEGVETDVIKVCDFGIAKINEPENSPKSGPGRTGAKLTTQGLVVGTPEYMSPEQAKGEQLDARSDIYAMGVILYQLITGRVPFDGESAIAVVLKHVTEPPPRPSSLFQNIDPALEEISMKALAKDRNGRYQSAREMRTDLRAALDGMPSNPAAPSAPRGLATTTEPLALARTALNVSAVTGEEPAVPSSTVPAAPELRPSVPRTSSKVTPAGTASAQIAEVPKSSRRVWPIALVAVLALGGGAFFAFNRYKLHAPQDHLTASLTATATEIAKPETSATSVRVPEKVSTVVAETRREEREHEKGRTHNVTTHVATPAETAQIAPTADPTPPPSATVAIVPPASVAPPTPPPPSATQAAPPPPQFNSATCHASVGAVATNGAVSRSNFHDDGLGGVLSTCAVAAGARVGHSISFSDKATVHFDEDGRNKTVNFRTTPEAAGLGECVRNALKSNTRLTVGASSDITGEPEFTIPVTFSCD